MLKRKQNKKKKGFTLIELVIVLAVLAIIALIAIPNFTKVRQDSMKKADERTGDVIKRVVLTNIADQKIKVAGAGTITITPNEDDATATSVETTENVTIDEDDMESIVGDLREVKKPQEKTKTAYIVEIDANENVTSVVTGSEE
ncbi:MAG: pilus assembly FimT family protein [Sarcina sp.]